MIDSHIRFLTLQGEVYKNMGMHAESFSCFEKAKDIMASSRVNDLRSNDNELSSILLQMGMVSEDGLKNTQQAIELYNQAIQSDSTNLEAKLKLARSYHRRGDVASAQSLLQGLLLNTGITCDTYVFLAELMYSNRSFTEAFFHFNEIIKTSPTNFKALSKLVELSWRMNRMNDVKAILARLENNSKILVDPGFLYCQGLYFRYVTLRKIYK